MKFHLIHDWSKWSAPIDTRYDCTKVQSRACNICNRVQVKKISQPFNIWFAASNLLGQKASEPEGGAKIECRVSMDGTGCEYKNCTNGCIAQRGIKGFLEGGAA